VTTLALARASGARLTTRRAYEAILDRGHPLDTAGDNPLPLALIGSAPFYAQRA
jgi:hypothetical protein